MAILINEDEVVETIEKNTIASLRAENEKLLEINHEWNKSYQASKLARENLHADCEILKEEVRRLRQELERLTESANKDRAALNLIEDALRGRGRE